jgi:hypothetical protein
MEDPPETIKTVDDLTVSITGTEFVARPGTVDTSVRTDIVSSSPDELILRISTPPTLEATVVMGAYLYALLLCACVVYVCMFFLYALAYLYMLYISLSCV